MYSYYVKMMASLITHRLVSAKNQRPVKARERSCSPLAKILCVLRIPWFFFYTSFQNEIILTQQNLLSQYMNSFFFFQIQAMRGVHAVRRLFIKSRSYYSNICHFQYAVNMKYCYYVDKCDRNSLLSIEFIFCRHVVKRFIIFLKSKMLFSSAKLWCKFVLVYLKNFAKFDEVTTSIMPFKSTRKSVAIIRL